MGCASQGRRARGSAPLLRTCSSSRQTLRGAWGVAHLPRVSRGTGVLWIWGKRHQVRPTWPLAVTQSPPACPRGSQVCGPRHTVPGTGDGVCVLAAAACWDPVVLPDSGHGAGARSSFGGRSLSESRAASSGAQQPRSSGQQGQRRVVHGHPAPKSRGEGAGPSLRHRHALMRPWVRAAEAWEPGPEFLSEAALPGGDCGQGTVLTSGS